MVVNTHRLFIHLLPVMRITIVCDVGSMNGADAARFSAAVPRARIYAFEPNPHNFSLMEARRGYFQQRNISLVPAAASNYDGAAEFFLVEAQDSQPDCRRGMSSLYRRTGEWASAAALQVPTTRLDTFLAGKCPQDARLAMWIDAEGAAYEVIEGLAGVMSQVHLVHVEVETTPCIGTGQKLYPQVSELLQRHGFIELATDQPRGEVQFNALFVRARLSASHRLGIAIGLLRARMRLLLVRAAVSLCPACVRSYLRMRARSRA
jgi:FkbM family methyltransferase